MRRSRLLGVVIAVLALAVAASSAQAAPKARKHKKEHAVHGVVKAVEKDKDGGKITVLVGERRHKKGGGAATAVANKPAVEKTMRVTAETKFVKMSGKKGAKEATAATLADLKDGDLVAIEARGNKAQEVKFHAGHHHKKGKKKAAA